MFSSLAAGWLPFTLTTSLAALILSSSRVLLVRTQQLTQLKQEAAKCMRCLISNQYWGIVIVPEFPQGQTKKHVTFQRRLYRKFGRGTIHPLKSAEKH